MYSISHSRKENSLPRETLPKISKPHPLINNLPNKKQFVEKSWNFNRFRKYQGPKLLLQIDYSSHRVEKKVRQLSESKKIKIPSPKYRHWRKGYGNGNRKKLKKRKMSVASFGQTARDNWWKKRRTWNWQWREGADAVNYDRDFPQWHFFLFSFWLYFFLSIPALFLCDTSLLGFR